MEAYEMPQMEPTQEDSPMDTDICPNTPGVPGRAHPGSARGVSAADTHILLRASGVFGTPGRHTERQALPE